MVPGERRETRDVRDHVRLRIRVRLIGDQGFGCAQSFERLVALAQEPEDLADENLGLGRPSVILGREQRVSSLRHEAERLRGLERIDDPRVAEEQVGSGLVVCRPELDRGAVEPPRSLEGAERVGSVARFPQAEPCASRQLLRGHAGRSIELERASGSGARASRRGPRVGPSDSIQSAARRCFSARAARGICAVGDVTDEQVAEGVLALAPRRTSAARGARTPSARAGAAAARRRAGHGRRSAASGAEPEDLPEHGRVLEQEPSRRSEAHRGARR